MTGVRNKFPGLLESMTPSLRHLRNAQRKYGLVKPAGALSTDFPVLSVSDTRIQSAVVNFGRKFMLALYYKHAGKVLPRAGGIFIRWYSNLQVESDEIPRDFKDVLPVLPPMHRSNRNLIDEFFYRSGVTEGGTMGIFFAFFRRSFAIFGAVAADSAARQAPSHIPLHAPYAPSTVQ